MRKNEASEIEHDNEEEQQKSRNQYLLNYTKVTSRPHYCWAAMQGLQMSLSLFKIMKSREHQTSNTEVLTLRFTRV